MKTTRVILIDMKNTTMPKTVTTAKDWVNTLLATEQLKSVMIMFGTMTIQYAILKMPMALGL